MHGLLSKIAFGNWCIAFAYNGDKGGCGSEMRPAS
jgi:hypothetical protein